MYYHPLANPAISLLLPFPSFPSLFQVFAFKNLMGIEGRDGKEDEARLQLSLFLDSLLSCVQN
jgi:hypothetical protein